MSATAQIYYMLSEKPIGKNCFYPVIKCYITKVVV